MITIPSVAFKAAIISAPSKDLRYYLNGVLIDRGADGHVYIVSTDGARLFVGILRNPACDQAGPWKIIIPIAVAKAAAKAKGHVHLQALPDGRYELAGQVFSPVDGVYPDWRRVVPKGESSETAAQYNFQFVADGQAQIAIWHGSKTTETYFHQAGVNVGVVSGPDNTAFAVIMPLRSKTQRMLVPTII